MSRILLAWEMGSNLGHLSRLLPIGHRLRARGHGVLAVVRDLEAAAQLLAPAGVPFIQAPRTTSAPAVSTQPASYADLLRYSGWADVQQLWAMIQAWVNVLRLFAPEVLIVDHSPTALLAARCERVATVAIGTGFELPPMRQPLPCFPGFRGATLENAISAERLVVENANRVMRAARGRSLGALSELFECERRWMTTFPELDHYEARPGERYVGPIGEVGEGERLEWPGGSTHQIFAYLRPDTPNVEIILRVLAGRDASVVCYAPGLPPSLTAGLASDKFVLAQRPVDLSILRRGGSLCVSYAPAATVTSALLAGVPQLMAPSHVEAQLTAHRVELLGAGITLRGTVTEQVVADALNRLAHPGFKARSVEFAHRYQEFDASRACDTIVEDLELLLQECKQRASTV
jgi:UDP:flavonoid glycosyltransferase YjiC (YdhE family)